MDTSLIHKKIEERFSRLQKSTKDPIEKMAQNTIKNGTSAETLLRGSSLIQCSAALIIYEINDVNQFKIAKAKEKVADLFQEQQNNNFKDNAKSLYSQLIAFWEEHEATNQQVRINHKLGSLEHILGNKQVALKHIKKAAKLSWTKEVSNLYQHRINTFKQHLEGNKPKKALEACYLTNRAGVAQIGEIFRKQVLFSKKFKARPFIISFVLLASAQDDKYKLLNFITDVIQKFPRSPFPYPALKNHLINIYEQPSQDQTKAPPLTVPLNPSQVVKRFPPSNLQLKNTPPSPSPSMRNKQEEDKKKQKALKRQETLNNLQLMTGQSFEQLQEGLLRALEDDCFKTRWEDIEKKKTHPIIFPQRHGTRIVDI